MFTRASGDRQLSIYRRIGLSALLIVAFIACAPTALVQEEPTPQDVSLETSVQDLTSDTSSRRTTTRIHSYFSPHGKTQAAILRVIQNARREIMVSMYTFTESDLADALIAAKERGVDVTIILDKTMASARYTQAHRLNQAGVPVYFDRQHRIMHNKFACVDREILMTGSQNWTKNADVSNAENTLIIKNNRYLVDKYRDRFIELRDTSDQYQARMDFLEEKKIRKKSEKKYFH